MLGYPNFSAVNRYRRRCLFEVAARQPPDIRGQQRLVTSGLAAPACSPDGKHLAVVEDRTTIKVVSMVTNEARRLVVGQQLGAAEYPTAPEDLAWSAHGKRIA